MIGMLRRFYIRHKGVTAGQHGWMSLLAQASMVQATAE
jgi:hypothetical protein